MSSAMRSDAAELLDGGVHFPEHVIFRSFADETVALNLQTGQFHGLNATAGRMVELIQGSTRPRDVIAPLAAEYGVSPDEIERDLATLLAVLLERGLIELQR
jgi:Coenzyme PQQ synthesis protein D (PqqD)